MSAYSNTILVFEYIEIFYKTLKAYSERRKDNLRGIATRAMLDAVFSSIPTCAQIPCLVDCQNRYSHVFEILNDCTFGIAILTCRHVSSGHPFF